MRTVFTVCLVFLILANGYIIALGALHR